MFKKAIALVAIPLCVCAIPVQLRLGPSVSPYTYQSDLTQWLDGNDGTNATARIGSNGYYVGNNCVNFAVANTDNIATGVALNFGSGDYSGSITFRITANLTSDYLLDGRDADNDGFRVIWLDSDFSGGDNRLLISHNTSDLSVYGAADLDDGEVHTVEWRRVGSTLYGSIDGGTEYSTSISGNIDVTTPARAGNQSYALVLGLLGDLFEAKVDGYFHYTCAEGDGSTVYDRSDNGNDGTITGATWTTGNGPAHNGNNGFDLWTKDVGGNELRVALQDDDTSVKGSGDSITGYTWQSKHLGGYVHNGSESSLVWAAGTNTLSELQALDGYSGLPIRNIYTFMNTPSAVFTNTVINITPWSGVYESP